jgi:hypothetical protein
MTLMKITILHSMMGVASAAVIAVAVAGNVVGQTAAPPAGLPPVSPAPALAERPPTPGAPPLPSPARMTPPEPVGVSGLPAPTPSVGQPRAVRPAGIQGAGAGANPGTADPTEKPRASEVPIAGGAAPVTDALTKGEFVTREWKVSPSMFDDGHGGTTNASDVLQQNGVTFEKGAFAIFIRASSTLVVKNTPEQIKLVEGVISHSRPAVEVGAPGFTSGFGGTISVSGGKSGRGATATLGGGLAPSAVNHSEYAPSPTPPRPGARIGVEGVSGIVADSAYAVSGEFPVTSVEVGRAHLAGELNHDPQASASRYAAIVANFDAQRQAAATAVYGLGEAYRKMGRNVEARVQYARILREFVDFPELTRQSQRQLSTTSSPADPDSAGGISDGGRSENVQEERALLREELELLERELVRTQDRIKAGVEPTSSALQLQRDILRLKQQLARLPRVGGGAPPTPLPEGGGAGLHDSHGARGEAGRLEETKPASR